MKFVVCKANDDANGWFINSNEDNSLYVNRDGYIINMCYNYQLYALRPESLKNLYFDSEDKANEAADMINGYDWNSIERTLQRILAATVLTLPNKFDSYRGHIKE